MDDIILCGRSDGVAKSKLLTRLDQFATLATRLDNLNVTPLSLECHGCHAGHTEKKYEPENISPNQTFPGICACMKWLLIVIEEGHVEASQPSVGKITGWPQRGISIKSLWVDFVCWCHKQKIPKAEMPEQMAFFKLLDQVFIRTTDKYEFPPLDLCRTIFTTLRRQYECI